MTRIPDILLVALGGAIGSILRYAMSLAASRTVGERAFPIATLLVNWIGSLAIGYLVGRYSGSILDWDRRRLFYVTGILGGFSAFSLEAATLIEQRRVGTAAAYAVASVVGGVGLAIAGARLAR